MLDGVSREHVPQADLRAFAGASTGRGVTSSLTAEIVGAVVAAVAAATLIERSPPGSAVPPGAIAVPRQQRDYISQHALPADRNGRRDVVRLASARTPALPAGGQICAVFAVDIVGFTRPDRDDDIRLYLHERLYQFLQKAFDDSGVPWDGCFCEDRGDGALIVVPPDIPVKGIIDPLPDRLRSLIRRHNHVSRDAAGIQLRAAAHIGPVDHDGYGFVGSDVNFVFRMLEARLLRRMLADSGAELALAVSDFVYHSLVCRYPSLVPPDTFRTFRFQVKNTRARAWSYLPGGTAAARS